MSTVNTETTLVNVNYQRYFVLIDGYKRLEFLRSSGIMVTVLGNIEGGLKIKNLLSRGT